MVKHKKAANASDPGRKKICFMCTKLKLGVVELCGNCITRLKFICASNEGETDSVLAAAIREGRVERRRRLVH